VKSVAEDFLLSEINWPKRHKSEPRPTVEIVFSEVAKIKTKQRVLKVLAVAHSERDKSEVRAAPEVIAVKPVD